MKQVYTLRINATKNIGINEIPTEQVWQWLAAAWKDIQQAPGQSLFFGTSLTLLSIVISVGVIVTGNFYLLLPLLAGFLLIAPFIGIGPYSISQQLEQNENSSLKVASLAWSRNSLQLFSMGLVLLVSFIVWYMLARLIFFSFYDGQIPSDWQGYIAVVLGSWEGLQILTVGTFVGGMLAIVVFAFSAVSIPMLMDRPVSFISAMRTSLAAVRYNLVSMLLWGGMLVTIIYACFMTAFLGFIIGFPLAAHGTWHAYRDLVTVREHPLE
ncbi:MAG: DUF2189 domain-containing protein [Candidatus Thiodiazotropha sp. (ex Clathrolucina costata)]|nr:DUF2189 domain-containing protein [Candidatus Thiodiazotropha taylori]